MDKIMASSPFAWLWGPAAQKPKEGIGDDESAFADLLSHGSDFYLALNFKDFFIHIRSSDLVYSGIIAILVLAILFLWLDYRRVKRRARRQNSANQR